MAEETSSLLKKIITIAGVIAFVIIMLPIWMWVLDIGFVVLYFIMKIGIVVIAVLAAVSIINDFMNSGNSS